MQEEHQEGEAIERPEPPGKSLRSARKIRQLGQEEVAQRLRLDVKLIQALEEDDYAVLPSSTYVCGYLRSYARLLGIPEDEVVDAYSHQQKSTPDLVPQHLNFKPMSETGSRFSRTLIYILLLLVIVAAGAWWLLQEGGLLSETRSGKATETVGAVNGSLSMAVDQPDPAVSTPTTQNLPEQAVAKEPAMEKPLQQEMAPEVDVAPPGPPEETALAAPVIEAAPVAPSIQPTVERLSKELEQSSSGVLLELEYSEDSWTDVTDATGQRLIYRMVEKGSTLEVRGTPPFTIRLGFAPGVQVIYKGKLFKHNNFTRNNVAYFKVGHAEASP